MKALTVRQPWADAIVHVDHHRWGRKSIENRSWPVPPALLGTRFLIHAGKTGDRTAILAGILPGPDVRGAIIGSAVIKSCHAESVACHLYGCGPWANPEVYHWVLADITALPDPVPAKGALGFWTPQPDVLAAIQQQLDQLVTT